MRALFFGPRVSQRTGLMALGVVALLTIGQTLPPALPPRQLPKIGVVRAASGSFEGQIIVSSTRFSIGGRKYASMLARSQAMLGAGWTSSSPLPIGLPKAEQIARAELRNLVPDDSGWDISEFRVSRAEGGVGWYMAVTLEPKVQVTVASLPPDSANVLIDFTGNVGKISRVLDQKQP